MRPTVVFDSSPPNCIANVHGLPDCAATVNFATQRQLQPLEGNT